VLPNMEVCVRHSKILATRCAGPAHAIKQGTPAAYEEQRTLLTPEGERFLYGDRKFVSQPETAQRDADRLQGLS
jgi:hypothetical protein